MKCNSCRERESAIRLEQTKKPSQNANCRSGMVYYTLDIYYQETIFVLNTPEAGVVPI
jgi:hypothetical protein